MEVSMTAAAISLLYAAALGAALAAVYDLVRLLRVLFCVDVRFPFGDGRPLPLCRYLFAALGDLFFFAVASASVCAFFFLTGDGRVRGYGLFGTAVGFLLYYYTVGALCIRVYERSAAFVRSAVRTAARYTVLPFVFCARKMRKWLSPLAMRQKAVYNQRKEARKTRKTEKQRKKRMRARTDLCRNAAPKRSQE